MTDQYAWTERRGIGLLTDFYELTMMAGYLREGRETQLVCFEYFFRDLPHDAGFAIAAGLEPFLDFVTNLSFTKSDIAYLESLDVFDAEFLTYLANFEPSFTIRAVPEGSLVFPHEPVVQVQGTIFEGQLIESALLNMLNYQTLIATKAARICMAANGEPVLEFGLRRAHGPDGALSGSRAAYIGGCTSTSNVLAGKVYGIPVSGTHAHSWVMSFSSEKEAFEKFARMYPERCVLLVDTYDTVESGVPNAIEVFKQLHADGHTMRPAIRLDSGDLAKLSKIAHRMMTEAGFEDPMIVASNDLEEDLIADLKRQGARINAWGVGTHLITSHDCPALNGVYKLVGIHEDGAWQPRIKISSNLEKATNPGRKEVVRYFDEAGAPLGDVLFLAEEDWPKSGAINARKAMQPQVPARIRNAVRAQALLEECVCDGKRTRPAPPIDEVRARAQSQIAIMPEEYRRLRNPELYRVYLSESLAALKEDLFLRPEFV